MELHIESHYYKTGDDFDQFLREKDGNVVAALRAWADNLSSFAENLRELTVPLEGKEVKGYGNTHQAFIVCNEDTGKKALATGVVYEEEISEYNLYDDDELLFTFDADEEEEEKSEEDYEKDKSYTHNID